MEVERNMLISTLKKETELLEKIWEDISRKIRISKHSGRSQEARKEGNTLFLQNNHDAETSMKIFSHYTRSISLAPLNSEELALAYGNRSAFLLRLAKYEDCVKDIGRALDITKSDLLKAKLYCRKVECLKRLGSLEYKSALDKAETYCNKVRGESKKSIIELLDKTKAAKRSVNNERQNIVILSETDNFLDCIAIKNNKRYGRHLIAKKNYEPGDVIFVEKLFVNVLDTENNYTNCNYCLKICWSGIACDYCSWAMFCSEDCKKTAWDSFHKIECSVIPFIRGLLFTLFDSSKIALRMLLIGIKEAGSIDKLKEDLKVVDESSDVHQKGVYKNGRFSSNFVQSVYLLKSDGFPDTVHNSLAVSIGIILITLVECSQFLPYFNGNTIEDIIKNEDLLFIGSLLLKLLKIKSNNCHSFSQNHCCCAKANDRKANILKLCCNRGSTLAPLASLINHSCFPNAGNCFTEDGKVLIYAIQSIKKDFQIFNSYVGHYFNLSIEERQNKIKKYHFKCDCLACAKSWPPLLILSHLQLEEGNYVIKSSVEEKLYNDCVSIFKALDYKTFNFKKKDIKILCTSIEKSQKFKQPSLLTSLLITALDRVYSHIYGFKLPMQLFDQPTYA